MVRLIVELSLPVILLAAAFAVKAYLKLERPSPRALGVIIPRLCVVGSDEILRYNEMDADQAEKHLRREARWKQFRVNRGYLNGMAWNTTLFQRALRFEKMKIDPGKSALDYQPRETLVWELVDDAAAMRWELFRWQAALLARSLLGLSGGQQVSISLLAKYKHLEQEMVALAGMADDDCYHAMLIERLGLNSWGLHEGGASEPA
jgi:hypothetical protein